MDTKLSSESDPDRSKAGDKQGKKTGAQLNQPAPGCCLQYVKLAALSSYTQRQLTPAYLKDWKNSESKAYNQRHACLCEFCCMYGFCVSFSF